MEVTTYSLFDSGLLNGKASVRISVYVRESFIGSYLIKLSDWRTLEAGDGLRLFESGWYVCLEIAGIEDIEHKITVKPHPTLSTLGLG